MKSELTEVFDGTLFESSMVMHLLENEGIQAVLKDTVTGSRSAGWRPDGGVKVIVRTTEVDSALRVVENYRNSLYQSDDR